MAVYQDLNPLDHIFFVTGEARKRLGLPGANVQLTLELDGPLDIAGFRNALTALHRLYPTTASRLVRSALTGRPRWRLDVAPPDMTRVLQIEPLAPATPEELHRRCERLLISPLDAANLPPLQFHLFRDLPVGDVLVMRWPHALMDARGGALVLEEVQRLYEEAPDPRSLHSVGDELRDDVSRLISGLSAFERTRLVFRTVDESRPENWQDARPGRGPVVLDSRGLHYMVRCLSPEQTRRIGDNALRVCGFARLGDFVRACAIQALHRVVPRSRPPQAGYSTMQLVDNRKRRVRAPVCHNFFSALPIYVPAQVAPDLRATADLIAQSTARMLSSGSIARRYAVLERLSRLPTSLLTRIMERALSPGKRAGLVRGLGWRPSLPMGFVGIQPIPSLCGAKLLRVHGVGAILPHEGLGLNVNVSSEALSITGAYYEPRVTADVMRSFLDHFIAALLDPS